jgi:hypothetical protein
MVWPLFYATIAIVLLAISRFRYRTAVALLTVAVVLQAADVSGMVRYIRDLNNYGYREPLQSRFWPAVAPNYQRLVLVPTNLCQNSEFVDYTPFSLLAGRLGLAINSGITARYDTERTREYCHDFGDELRAGIVHDEALYIVRPDLVGGLARAAKDASCTMVDGFGVCFSTASYARWSAGYDVLRERLPPAAEFTRFYDELDRTYATALGRPGIDAPGGTAVRLESIVRYLAYRLEGCDHALAERKALRFAAHESDRSLCGVPPVHHQVPPADQTLAFVTRLDDTLRAAHSMPLGRTHIDREGEAVWIQAYVQERVRGLREQDAREKVLTAIRGLAH